MKIYIAHSRDFDYVHELYAPLEESLLAFKYDFVFPHKLGEGVNSKEVIRECDLFIAEVSLSSVGVGIEMGWADAYNVPIVCLYRSGSKISRALGYITEDILEYTDSTSLVGVVERALVSLVAKEPQY